MDRSSHSSTSLGVMTTLTLVMLDNATLASRVSGFSSRLTLSNVRQDCIASMSTSAKKAPKLLKFCPKSAGFFAQRPKIYGGGGGVAVSVLTVYYDNPSSNPSDNSYFEQHLKIGRGWSVFYV